MAASAYRPDRRAVLTAAGMMMAAALPLRAAGSGPRLAAIDWAMLEAAVALGRMPIAACELIRFREDAIEPPIPNDVVDLGLRGAPNFELLQLTRPDLILTSPYYAGYQDRLAALAPVISHTFYDPGQPPLPAAIAALHRLAEAIDDPAAGRRAEAGVEAELQRRAAKLGDFADLPVCLISLGDSRHMRVFGFDSLFGSTLVRLGLTNAWDRTTRFSFLAPVRIEKLAELPAARLVIVGQVSPAARRGLQRSVLWRMLPPVAANRLYILPDVNAFGATPSALRFARLLSQALAAEPVSAL